MDCFYLKKLTFEECNRFKTLKSVKIPLYLLQNKIHQLCKLLFEIEPIKFYFFSVKIHVFRVKDFRALKNYYLFDLPKVSKVTTNFF